MARSRFRAVAGAGTVAAFLLLGGAAIPVVSADPGHSHGGNGSHRGGDSRGGDGRDSRPGEDRRGQRDRGDDGGWQRGGDPVGANRTNDPRALQPGDGASPSGARKPNTTAVAPRTATTGRSEAQIGPSVSGPQATVGSVDGPAAPASLAPTPAGTAVPVPPVSGGGGGGASAAMVAAPHITPPRVTVGNGRAPGILTGQHEKAPTAEIPVASPAVTPPVSVQLPPPYRLDVAPAESVVASLWAAAAPGRPGGVLFGLAGLILAPIAGAWLGVRQARASKAAAQLIRH
jgi:hypothetical protein